MTLAPASNPPVSEPQWAIAHQGSDTFVEVCPLAALVPERGVAALLERPDGPPVQVALFRLLDDEVLAVQQLDPFSGANVMSRGIVGTRQGEPTVAGPVFKQVFALRTGVCLDSGGKSPVVGHDADLATFPVEVRDGVVNVGQR